MQSAPNFDAVIIGGGFYGSAIAIYLAKQRGFKQILLVEREQNILQRASYNNQARVHNGYHYPRSFTTAYRSRINLPKFVRDWPKAITRDFTKLYAVARRNSKVNASQFERFCREIGAGFQIADPTLLKLFEPRLIEQVYLTEEFAFDSTKLADWALSELTTCGVQLKTGVSVTELHNCGNNQISLCLQHQNQTEEVLTSRYVFNCTYSGLNQLRGDFTGISASVKQEITEMALIKLPPALVSLGITVMDGSYFSIMPFPARKLHTLSHVRYTPHTSWVDKCGIDPYEKLFQYDRLTRSDRMIRDVARYLPGIVDAKYIDSLFEVKTVLVKNEGDDGRPIFFEKHANLPGCFSILGGKIDNIYDVLEKLNSEHFTLTATAGVGELL
jgi:glycine/D-amino acid oxidase-like deaminating enzyme